MRITAETEAADGEVAMFEACEGCHGVGRLYGAPCPTCEGRGWFSAAELDARSAR